jgi:hypothetical protein
MAKYARPTQDLFTRTLDTNADLFASRRKRLEDGMFSTGTDASISEKTDDARDIVRRSYGVAEGALEREQRGLGVALSDRAARAQKKRLGLARAASEVSAGEITRAAEMDRADAIGDMSFARQDALEMAALGLTDTAATMENNRNMQKVIRDAQKRASKLNLVSKAVGVAAGVMTGNPLLIAGSLGSGG